VHILRHTFCSHLAMRGAAPKAIQDLAGHQHLSTTMRYMHLSPSEPSAYSTGGELTAQWRHMTGPRAHPLRMLW
jgi:integrase